MEGEVREGRGEGKERGQHPITQIPGSAPGPGHQMRGCILDDLRIL